MLKIKQTAAYKTHLSLFSKASGRPYNSEMDIQIAFLILH